MPQAVTAIFGGDSQQLVNELRRVEVMAAASGRKIESGLSGTTGGFSRGKGSMEGHGGRGGVIGETVVILRELGRGNYARLPGSLTILAQRMGALKFFIKDNALAANELTVAMEQQAVRAANLAKWTQETAIASRAAYMAEGTNTVMTLAQVDADETSAVASKLNAEAMREKAVASRAAGAAAGFAIGPIGWLAIGLVAVGAAAWYTIKHFRTLATQVKNLADLMNPFKKSFTDEAKAMQEDAKAAEDFKHWLKELNSEHQTETELMERKLKLMQEEGKERRELMKLRGASARELNRFDIDQLRVEREMLLVEQRRIKVGLSVAENAAKAAQSNLTSNPKNAGGVALEGAKLVAANAGEIAQAAILEFEARKDKGLVPTGEYTSTPGEEMPSPVMRKLSESDKLTFKVGSSEIQISVAQAKANFYAAAQAAKELEALEKQLVDTLADTKKTAKEKADALKKIGGEILSVEEKLGIRSGIGMDIARAEDLKKQSAGGFALNQQQKMGAYAAAPPDWKRIVDATVRTALNTENLRPADHNPVGTKSTQHGSAWHTVWRRQ